MKNRFRYLRVAALGAALLMGISVSPVMTGWAETKEEEKPLTPLKAAGSWIRQAENQDLALWIYDDGKLMNFALEDKATGQKLYASPFETAEEASGLSDRLKSQLSITFNDTTSAEQTMNSFKHSVSKTQHTVYKIDQGLRIEYVLGAPQESRLLPEILRKETYEALISTLDEKEQKRVNLYYKLQSLSEMNEEVKAQWLETYPALAEHDLYILASNANTKAKNEMEGYWRKTELTLEKMKEEYQILDYLAEGSNDPSFLIPLELVLEEKGLVARIDNEDIVFDSTHFHLFKISLLEFFGAAPEGAEGFLLLPDGSGSIVSFTQSEPRAALTQTGTLYGRDLSDENDTGTGLYYHFPVFGLVKNGVGYTAILRANEAGAEISAELAGSTHSLHTAFSVYNYAARAQAPSGDPVDPIWNLYEKKPSTQPYEVIYSFLTGEDADPFGMADTYREHLKAQGMTPMEEKKGASFVVEMMGAMDSTGRFLFIPVTVETPLSTFEDGKSLLTRFEEAGIENLTLRLTGWCNGGYTNTPIRGLSVAGTMGGTDGLRSLTEHSASLGYRLTPDADFIFFDKQTIFDGWQSHRDALRTVEGKTIRLAGVNAASYEEDEDFLRYTVNALRAEENSGVFFGEMKKLGLSGVSLSSIGSYVSASYPNDDPIHPSESAAAFARIAAGFEGDVLADGINAYLYPVVDALTNVPVSDSGLNQFGEAFPFLQTVLRGYVELSAAPMNLSDDPETAWLSAVEYGIAPSVRLAFQNVEKLRSSTELSASYAVNAAYWMDQSIAVFAKAQTVLDQVAEGEIVGHSRVGKKLYRTDFSNGKTILVNYADDAADWNGVTVPGKDCTVIPTPAGTMEGGEAE
ncbi:MAG: hypothetical protein IJY82_06840 [Oscillospiraceae bacterium]|nr:hypothetical protein [Oscillospiraceae bacterium]